jgi:hypothetical protein
MGYNIELSFNILKHSCVTDIQETVTTLAHEYNCNHCYTDYEFDKNLQYQRTHCLITVVFENANISSVIDFLKKIKGMNGLYIESICDDTTSDILYASQYYLTQMMNKNCAINYKLNKRKRSYSEDDTMILKEVEKKNYNML